MSESRYHLNSKSLRLLQQEKELIENQCVEKDQTITELVEKQDNCDRDSQELLARLESLSEQAEKEHRSRMRIEEDYEDLLVKMNQLNSEKLRLVDEVETLGVKKQELEQSRSDLVQKHDKLKNEHTSVADERESLLEELKVGEEKLLAANEGRIQAEKKMIALREELQSTKCQMDQEISSLKFHISSEAMKYKQELKVGILHAS